MATVQNMGNFVGYNFNDLVKESLRLCFQRVTTDSDGVVTGDFSRYTLDMITDKINDALLEMAIEARMLQTFAIIKLKDGVREYPVPSDCFSIIDVTYFDSGGTPGLPLEVYSFRYARSIRPYLFTLESSPPEFCYLGDVYGNARKLGIYPIPSEDGSAVTFAGALGVVTSQNLGTLSGDITGLHDGTGNSASLIDTTVNFVTEGIAVGMMAHNTTDGSSGQITAISTTTNTNDTLAMTLSGGTQNDWDVGDSYVISAGEYGEIITADSEDMIIFSGALGGINNVNATTKNIMMTYYRYPGIIDKNDQYPECFKYFQMALPYGAASKLLMYNASMSDFTNKSGTYYQMFQNYIEKGRRHNLHTELKPRNIVMRPRIY